jgi:hypothetical protein
LKKAVDLYKDDFERILIRLTTHVGCQAAPTTFLERRLAEFVGQSIRFHLRRLFNPPPLPYTRPKEDKPETPRLPEVPKDPSLRQSRVFEIIDLQLPETSRDSAVADGSVSSLFSLALNRIYDFFGMEAFVSAITSQDPIRLPETFCSSPVSQRGLGTPKQPSAPLTPAELQQVLGDIDGVYKFLAAYQACKFLLELTGAPGVKEEIRNMGGWSTVEEYCKILRRHKLHDVCVEDAHFSVLGHAGNMERFFAKVEEWLSHMEPKVPLAEIGIANLAKRYRTKINSPKQRRAIHKKFPHVKTIGAAIDEGNSRCIFPEVVVVACPVE